MSDQVKTTDQVKEGAQKPNDCLEKPPDAPELRSASNEQVSAAREQNPNKTKGMTELAYKDGFVDSEDKRSVEIEAINEKGEPVKIDKNSTIREKNICIDPHPTAEAETMIKAQKEASASDKTPSRSDRKEAIADTGTLEAIAGNPNLPQEKQDLARQYQDMRKASKELGIHTEVIDDLATEVFATELAALKPKSPQDLYQEFMASNRAELDDRYQASDRLPVPKLEGYVSVSEQKAVAEPENPWNVLLKLTPEQLDAVMKTFEEGEKTGVDAWNQKTQAISESIPHGFYNVGKALYDSFAGAGKFVHDVYFDHDAAVKTGGEVGETIGKAIVGGVKFGQLMQDYAANLQETGAYSKPFEDVATLGHILNECWNEMPLEQKTEKGSELIAGLGVMGIGKKWDELARSGKLVDMLDELAEPFMNQSAEVKAKAAQAIKKFVNEIILDQQPAVTPDGHVLMMKGDKGLPQGIKPSEKLQPKRSFNERGEQVSTVEIPDEVMKIAELHGFDSAVIQGRLQKLSDVLQETFFEIGEYNPAIHGSERQYGIAFHEMLRKSIGNDDIIHAELSFRSGDPAKWGQLGSSRIDIGLGDRNQPFASLCFKTLRAVPSAQQERGWARNLPKLRDGSVPPRFHLKLPEQE